MATDLLYQSDLDISQLVDKPWTTIVWDDPVNLMSYVTMVFVKLFGFTQARAMN
jgi:ATP-dependent Clp protease adaptor protein ClpS